MKKFKAIFYKSQGNWVGPYRGELFSPSQFDAYSRKHLPYDKAALKSKISIRTVRAKNVIPDNGNFCFYLKG